MKIFFGILIGLLVIFILIFIYCACRLASIVDNEKELPKK